MYNYRFDYAGGCEDDDGCFVSEPPRIYITGPDGFDFMEVLVDPEATVHKPACDDEHWRTPQIVINLLAVLNTNADAITKQA